MNPSQLVDVVLKSIQQQGTMREARRCEMEYRFFGSSTKNE